MDTPRRSTTSGHWRWWARLVRGGRAVFVRGRVTSDVFILQVEAWATPTQRAAGARSSGPVQCRTASICSAGTYQGHTDGQLASRHWQDDNSKRAAGGARHSRRAAPRFGTRTLGFRLPRAGGRLQGPGWRCPHSMQCPGSRARGACGGEMEGPGPDDVLQVVPKRRFQGYLCRARDLGPQHRCIYRASE